MKKTRALKTRVIEFLFFGNYFYALIALALSLESAYQQGVGLNGFVFYLLLCSGVIVYYTYAYMGEISFRIAFFGKRIRLTPPNRFSFYNRRTLWYQRNERLLNATQILFLIIIGICSLYLIILEYHHIFSLTVTEWVLLLSVPVVAIFYYGNAYFPIFRINLRQSGWLKPFVVGFVWAGTVTIYPIMFHKWQHDVHYNFNFLNFWYLVKNWMFISVLAIMFDIKDYADDANGQLKTFVVRVGLRRTIFQILLPLTLFGVLAFTIFAYGEHFSLLRYLFNLIPFFLLLWLAYSMHKRHAILYYLIIIDGLLVVKSICGILAAVLF